MAVFYFRDAYGVVRPSDTPETFYVRDCYGVAFPSTALPIYIQDAYGNIVLSNASPLYVRDANGVVVDAATVAPDIIDAYGNRVSTSTGTVIWAGGLFPSSGGGSPVYGNIISATINADGYTANIRVTGTLTSPITNFGNYALDPDGTPKMTLSCSHSGYSASGGIAVPDIKTRTIIGTFPHRDVATYGATVPDPNKITETDNGDGTITVRIALSETVFATVSSDGGDTAMTLTLAANWRGSDAGCTDVPVTNSSTVLTPRPGHRWADVPSRRVTGNTIRASLVGLSFYPQQLRGLAAVKFTMRDTAGTVKTVWTTGLTTSTTYGGTDRLYEVDLDVSTGTPFVAGLVRIDAELYPWIGAMRSTDNGTGMTALAQTAKETPSQRPDCVAYDPAGTHYRTGADYIHISSAGTATASSVTVAADAATAKAGTHAADFAVALHAAYLANRSIAGLTRPIDGMVFVLGAGTHNINPTNKNFLGIACTGVETWATLSGDLTDADPSQNCIFEASSVTCRPRGTQHWRFSNMSVYCGGSGGTSVFWSTDSIFHWWDVGSIRRGSVGRETSAAAMASGFTTPVGYWTSWATGSKGWKYGRTWLAYGFERFGLVRNCQTSRSLGTALSLGNTFIQHLDTFITAGNGDQVLHTAPYTTLTDLGAVQDYIQIGNDMRSTEGRSFDAAYCDAATGGTTIKAPNIIAFPYVSYNFHVNNLLERYHNTGASAGINIWGGTGEQNDRDAYACMFEGNTIVGQRNSFMFCKPQVTSNAAPITEVQKTNWASVIVFRNNAYDKTGEETDREAADPALTSYYTANALPLQLGMSQYRRGCDCIIYGTDCESNVNFSRLINGASGDIDNYQIYLGRNSVMLKTGVGAANAYKTDALYTSDQSMNGPITNGAAAGAGQGDYHPATGSLLIGRATQANLDRTLDNVARVAPFNTGAL